MGKWLNYKLSISNMEDSANQSENDAESQKLLYKYQYAFLHMQKSFTSLFKIVRLYEHKVSFRYLIRWKTYTFNVAIKQKFYFFRVKLQELEKKFRLRRKLALSKTFNEVIRASNYLQLFKSLKNQFKKVQENNNRELNLMEKEVVNLKKSQTELEGLTKNYSKKEIGYKMKIDNTSCKTLLDRLKIENKQLKSEIFEIDKKTFNLFKDLNFIMDELEEAKKKKLKKIKKKAKVVIRGKGLIPVST